MSERRAVGFVADLFNWPRRAICWHLESLVLTGNAIITNVSGSQIFNHVPLQNPAANGDVFTNAFLLRPGTYTMECWGATNADHGIIDWSIDDSAVVTGQDWYSAGLTFNVKVTATVQIKGASPWHVLKGTVNGKNASSTDYIITITYVAFTPSAD